MASNLTLDQFRSAFRAGGFQSVGIRGAGGEFFITGQPRSGGRVTLATTHGLRLRAFRDANKAIAVLHAIGAHNIQVDTSAWSPEKAASSSRKRPDTAARQRRAHEAVEHDAWFRGEVQRAMQEANHPRAKWISREQANQRSAVKRAEWLRTAETKRAAK